MDMNKLLKNINTLNEYILASRDVLEQNKNTKVQFNMPTVLVLKKIRSYEIEYFNKYEENGIACAALEYMVDLAPSKTWGVLGKEILNLIQYWLDAIRKHLISHSLHWWTFLRILLKFIKEVRQKDKSLPNLLVEQTAECLLDLATNERADTFQKYEILHCLNMYCADSNREIRFALRNKLGVYFTKLSTHMSSCGYFPCQLSVLETLLRWLVPRHDQVLRSCSAEKWFPPSMYSREAVEVFLNRTWMDFFQDARDFLNIHNKSSNLIVSVVCRSLSIGKIVIIPGKENHVSWLDINSRGKCLSVVLDPQMLETFGTTNLKSWETLLISEDNTQTAKLDRESHQLTISVTTFHPPHVLPSLVQITNEPIKHVKIVVSSKSDLTELDKALSGIFGDKYQMLINLDREFTESSSQDTRNNYNNSEEETKFSHPAVVKRTRHSGYIVRCRNQWNSPSTTSTTSLAQLHDRLAVLPSYNFDKEPVSVCVRPELSSITEATETDDRRSFQSATTLKLLRSYGVCYRESRKAQNDTSCERDESKQASRGLSPDVGRKTAPSCLLVATIGSTDDSVINNTMERLVNKKHFEESNIVDLLVKEALEANSEHPLDSIIHVGENKKTGPEENCKIIESTYDDNLANVTLKRGCAVIRESSSDESNTEVISGTPLNNINIKRKKAISKKSNGECLKNVENNVYYAQAVEEFFSQHFAENSVGDVLISPTLAKKINESSSETSDNFDERIAEIHENPQFDVDNTEVLDCLNCVVEKVCKDLDKYTDYLNIDAKIHNFICDKMQDPLDTVAEVQENLRKENGLSPKKQDRKSNNSITLKYIIPSRMERPNKRSTIANKKKSITKKGEDAIKFPENDEVLNSSRTINKEIKSKVNRKTKKNIKSGSELLNSTIVEVNKENENIPQNNDAVINPETVTTKTKPDLINDLVSEIDTSLIRRKRKLYSPKDDKISDERPPPCSFEADDDGTELTISKTKTPKSSTFYKEIEKERKKHTRKSRMRKSKIPEPPSPRTLKMNQVFDKLKETVESNEKITLADKTFEIDVYNFSSDSEEEYFKKKKILPRKRPSITTMGSYEPAMSTRHGRVTKKVNYNENKSSNESNSNQTAKRKRIVKKQKPINRKVSIEPVIDIEDQRMRQGTSDILNTSIIVENPEEPTYTEVEPVLKKVPELETIVDLEQCTKEVNAKNRSVKKNKKIELSLKKTNKSKTSSLDVPIKEDRTESPLPGLVVESTRVCIEDNNDSVNGTMLQKFKKIYQDGFDMCANETNTTQNLLSDVERINNSSYNNGACEIIDDANQIDNTFDRSKVLHVKQKAVKKKSQKKITTKHKRNPSHSVNVINISQTIEDKSDVSIATQGINAHGDMEEMPPTPAMIEEQVQPRNLGLEDLEQSLKDYFDHLRSQIIIGDDGPREPLDDSCTPKQEKRPKNELVGKKKSAKVVVARLSAEDIDKWISSDKSDSVKETETRTKQFIQSAKESQKSPIVSVSRLSSAEIEKWLPSCNNSISEPDHEKAQQKSVENKSIQSLYRSHNWLPSRRNSSSDVESVQNNQNEAEKSVIKLIFKGIEPVTTMSGLSSNNVTIRSQSNKEESLRKDKTKTKLNLYNDNLKNAHDDSVERNVLNESMSGVNINKSDAIPKRASVISPIKIGNFISLTRKTNTQTDNDEYVNRVRNIFAESERNISIKRKIIAESKSSTNHLEVLSIPNSTSTKIGSSTATKRKSVSQSSETKKQKVDVIHSVNVSESGPSSSSINEWFRRNEPSRTDEILQLSVIDCVQNVVEKLDTTLVDINQQTSKKLIHLFVDAQKQLNEHRERRHAMYKQAASDMLSRIVQIMDEKFSDLDKRSQEMDNVFMEQLRSRASQMILDDSKRKQAMVQIMKQDVESVVQFVKNKL